MSLLGLRDTYWPSKASTTTSSYTSSVTRYAEISPLWQNLKSFLQFFESLFCIWHTFNPIWTNLVCYCADFHLCKWAKNEKESSHVVTLSTQELLFDETYQRRYVGTLNWERFLWSLSSNVESLLFQSKYSEHIKIEIWILNTDFDFNEMPEQSLHIQTGPILQTPTPTCCLAAISVTRFGEISPLWQNLLSNRQYFEGIFCIWQLLTVLANFVCH